jgi:hypothetical protein
LFSGNFSLYIGQKFVFSKYLGGFDSEVAGEVLGKASDRREETSHDEK